MQLVLMSSCTYSSNSLADLEDFGAVAFPAGVLAAPERGVDRQREDMRQEVPRRVHDMDAGLRIFDGDVNVQTEDQVGPRDHLQVIDDLVVALVGRDRYAGPVRDRMRARGGDAQAALSHQVDDLAPEPGHLASGVLDIGADRRADFNDRLVHLALDLVLEPLLPFREDLGDMRPQLARFRIDDLKLLLDSEGEGRLWRHGGRISGVTGRSVD